MSDKIKNYYKPLFIIMLLLLTILITVTIYTIDQLNLLNAILTLYRYQPFDITQIASIPIHLYYNENDILKHAYPKNIQSVNDFNKWKNNGILNYYDHNKRVSDIKHEPVLTSTLKKDTYTLEKFSMQSHIKVDDIIFWRLNPNNLTSNTAIFIIPGSGHQGALDVIGETSRYEPYYYQNEIGKKIANNGYTVYVIELHAYGERATETPFCQKRTDNERLTCNVRELKVRLSQYGIDIRDIHNDEITTVLSYINSKHDRIIMSGLSYGGDLTQDQAIINHDVIDGVIIASGTGSMDKHVPSTNELTTIDQLLYHDNTDILATITPKPLYISFGKQESILFSWEANTNYTGNFIKQIYKLHNASNNFTYISHNNSHQYDVQTTLEFLKKHS